MTLKLPLLPLRDIVVFPHMIVPLFVGREKSVAALEQAMAGDKEILLVAQLDPGQDNPGRDDLYDMGVTATVLQLLKLPDGTVRVLVEGKQRARLIDVDYDQAAPMADVEPVTQPAAEDAEEIEALMRSVVDRFDNYAKLNKKLPAETAGQLNEITDASQLADTVSANLALKVADKQSLLVELDMAKRLEMALAFMEGELSVLQVEKKIRSRVKRQMEKSQREYYLNEQMKAIQRELGEGDDQAKEIEELRGKIDAAGMPEAVKKEALRELDRLCRLAARSVHSMPLIPPKRVRAAALAVPRPMLCTRGCS